MKKRATMTDDQIAQDPCPLCGGGVRSCHPAQPGYRIGLHFEVLHCADCDTSFVHPMEVDSTVYDAIYAHADEIPGYDRYAQYARTVAEVADPLDFLARTEDVYWAIRACVEQVGPGARILEVGSGLGYMTYALGKSGYDVTGMDISKVAVDSATARYGPHYQEADLADWSIQKAGEFEMVIMAELLEHVPDPIAFLQMAAKLLRPGGRLVITTPNKSCSPPWMLWETEAPPVHLWWFSETSMQLLAEKLGLGIDFVDFTPFNREHTETPTRIIGPNQPTFGALLDEHNQPLSREALRQAERKRRPSFYRIRKWKRSWASHLRALLKCFRPPTPKHQRGILCAVMTKSATASIARD